MDKECNIECIFKLKKITEKFLDCQPENFTDENMSNIHNEIVVKMKDFLELLNNNNEINAKSNVWKSRRMKGKSSCGEDNDSANMLKLRSLINKLSAEKYEKLSKRILEIEIDSFKTMYTLTTLLFEKMIIEKPSRFTYAKLLNSLNSRETLNEEGKCVKFQQLFLSKCQEEFENNLEKEPCLDKSIDEETQFKIHKYVASTVEMLGLLFAEKFMSFRILKMKCLDKLLLSAKENPRRYALENFCLIIKSLASSENSFDEETIKQYITDLNNLVEPAKKVQGMCIVFLIEDCVQLLTKINDKPIIPEELPERRKVITINKPKNDNRYYQKNNRWH